MKKHPYLVELIIFFLLMMLVLSRLYNIVRYKNVGSGGGMDNFYNTDVPIDVIAYGSSHAACTVNNGILWDDYGIASYTLSAGGQRMDATYYFLQESIAVNKPKVALVETILLTENEFTMESYYRSALTSRFSPRFLSYTFDAIKNNSIDRETAENMFLRMPIVHSRYKELEKSDFVNSEEYIRGYRGDKTKSSMEKPQKTDDLGEISEDALAYVDKMIDLCQKEDVKLIFFTAPTEISTEEYKRQNTLYKYVEERGCDYISFVRDDDKYGIDYDSDFREDGHLNDDGAEKVTRALGDYIQEYYPVPDRRGEEGYELWDKNLEFLHDRDLRYTLDVCKTLDEYLACLCDNIADKTCVLSFNGNYRALGDDIYKPYLGKIGINWEDYEKGGVWIIKNGKTEFYSDGAAAFDSYKQLGKSTDLNIFKNESDQFVNIWLDDYNLTPDCNGISVLLYDEECEYPIHAMEVNVYEGTDVINIELSE